MLFRSVGTAGNNYTNAVGAAGNSYAQQVGTAANTFADATYYKKTGGIISGDVGITGNLTISGTTTYANTTQLQVGDNIITLNADLPLSVTPIDNAGIEVNRGNLNSNASLLWIETAGRWSITGNTAQTITTYIASNTLVEQYASAGNSYSQQVGAAGNNWATATFATLSNVSIVYNTTNVAFNTANAAFAAANNITPQVAPSYNTANNAYNTANAAFGYANSLNTYVSSTYSTTYQLNYAWNQANIAYSIANAAYAQANAGGGGYFSGNNGDKGATNAGDIFRVHSNTMSQNVTILSGNNAICAGPLNIVGLNTTLTIQTGARVTIV